MTTDEAPAERAPVARRHRPILTFIISFSAAVCVAGGFAVMGVAAVFASAVLFDLSYMIVWIFNGIIGLAALWGFIWVFSRSWHVERRLAAGAELDEPNPSIIANWRD